MSAVTAMKPKGAGGSAVMRARALLSALNLHWTGVGLLAVVNLYLLAQMGLLWHAASNHNTDAITEQRIELKTAGIAAQPLRGLDAKLARATEEADKFSKQRLPTSDSEAANELGVLTKKQSVRLLRAQYFHTPVLTGSAGALTEVRIDATLSGDYRPLVEFINSVERDKMFFVIMGETLTGQQSGTVNLKLGMKTYEQGSAAQHLSAVDSAAAGATDTPSGGPGR
jgi:type IV pilus assembly protein PilO